jgi:hypothetical protein
VDEFVVHRCLLLAMLVVRSAGFSLDRRSRWLPRWMDREAPVA